MRALTAVAHVNNIVRKRRGISVNTALHLVRYFNPTPEFSLNLQTAHDLRASEIAGARKVPHEMLPRAA